MQLYVGGTNLFAVLLESFYIFSKYKITLFAFLQAHAAFTPGTLFL